MPVRLVSFGDFIPRAGNIKKRAVYPIMCSPGVQKKPNHGSVEPIPHQIVVSEKGDTGYCLSAFQVSEQVAKRCVGIRRRKHCLDVLCQRSGSGAAVSSILVSEQ